jgi:hypothetical protein
MRPASGHILRDAAKTPLLRMRAERVNAEKKRCSTAPSLIPSW